MGAPSVRRRHGWWLRAPASSLSRVVVLPYSPGPPAGAGATRPRLPRHLALPCQRARALDRIGVGRGRRKGAKTPAQAGAGVGDGPGQLNVHALRFRVARLDRGPAPLPWAEDTTKLHWPRRRGPAVVCGPRLAASAPGRTTRHLAARGAPTGRASRDLCVRGVAWWVDSIARW